MAAKRGRGGRCDAAQRVASSATSWSHSSTTSACEPVSPHTMVSVVRLALGGPESRAHKEEALVTKFATRSARSVSARWTTPMRRPCCSNSVSRKRNPKRVARSWCSTTTTWSVGEGRIGEHFQEFGAAIGDAGADIFDHLMRLMRLRDLGVAIDDESIRLDIQDGMVLLW